MLLRQRVQFGGECGGLPLQHCQRGVIRQYAAVGGQHSGAALGIGGGLLRLTVDGHTLPLRQRLPLGVLPAQVGGAALQRVQLAAGLLCLPVQ